MVVRAARSARHPGPRVLEAMATFRATASSRRRWRATPYEDGPLAIGSRADHLAAVHGGARDGAGGTGPTDRALEVGAGSGYQAAVLAAARGGGLRHRDRPRAGGARAPGPGASSATTTSSSIRSTAAAAGPSTPRTTSSSSRRARRASRPCWSRSWPTAGRLVIPVGGPEEQELAIVRREGDHYVTSHDTRCRYVDLLGRFGVGGAMPAA